MISSSGDRIRQRALKATLWSGADALIRQGLQFCISIALARLLAPEAFGTIALLYLFVGIAGLFVDGGLSSALIQRPATTRLEESTVFWFNLSAGAGAGLLLSAASPLIAHFFGVPLLQPLACIMGLNLFIGAFGSVHMSLLTKVLNFRTQMKIGLVASTVSGVAAIVVAWLGAGVWALAFQLLISTTITSLLLWVWHAWRPLRAFDPQALRTLWRFGGFFVLSVAVDIAYTQIYTLVIGKLYGTRDLGFYFRATSTQQNAANLLSGVLNRVAFPLFSSAAADKELLRRSVRKALTAAMILNLPIMFGIVVTADPLVIALFGEKWRPSVPILQILALGGSLWPLHVINLNVLLAQGHSNLLFRVEIVKKALGFSVLICASLFGLVAIAWSQVAFGLAAFFINAHYTSVLLGYGAARQIRDVAPYLAVAGVMAILVWLVGSAIRLGPLAVLAIQVSIGATFYCTACKWLRLRAFQDLLTTFKASAWPKDPEAGQA